MAQKYIKESASLFKIYFSLGECFRRIKQMSEAILFLEKATLIKKDDSDAQNTLGLSLFEDARYAEVTNSSIFLSLISVFV